MTCREFDEFLLEYTSGELSEVERRSFEAHTGDCPSCALYLKTYEETVRLGKAAFEHPDDPVPDQVPEELVRAILAARGKGP